MVAVRNLVLTNISPNSMHINRSNMNTINLIFNLKKTYKHNKTMEKKMVITMII